MERLIDKILANKAGLCIAEDEEHVDDVNEDDLHELASLFEEMVNSGEITLFGYLKKSERSVFEYLQDELRDHWTHICVSIEDPGMLCGCRIGYFTSGSGQGAEIITMRDFIDDSLSRKDGDTEALKFDSVF